MPLPHPKFYDSFLHNKCPTLLNLSLVSMYLDGKLPDKYLPRVTEYLKCLEKNAETLDDDGNRITEIFIPIQPKQA